MADVDVGVPVETGQDSFDAPVDAGQAFQTEAEPLFSFKHDDGKEEVFKTKEELTEAYRSGTLRHSDYTKKRQADSEARKAFERQQEEFRRNQDDFRRKQSEYKQYDDFLNKRPDVAKRIISDMKQQSGVSVLEQAQSMIGEETGAVKSQLQELLDWKRQTDLDRTRSGVYAKLKEQYPDFDEGVITSEMTRLSEMPPGEEEAIRSFAEMLYHTNRSRQGLASNERKEALFAEKNATIPKGGPSVNRSGPPDTSNMTFDQIAEAAKAGQL